MDIEKSSIAANTPVTMGHIENGFAAPYHFSISDVFKESWARVKGYKATFWSAAGLYFLALLLLLLASFLIQFIYNLIIGVHLHTKSLSGLLSIVRQILIYPMTVGFLMLGVKRAANLPTRAAMIIDYYPYIVRIIAVALWRVLSIGICFGGATFCFSFSHQWFYQNSMILAVFIFLIGIALCLVGIYLSLAYLFATQLVVEKNMGIWESLEVSRRAVSQHWFKFFFTFFLIVGIAILSCLPLGIGLIWAGPWSNITWGILYRTAFGVEKLYA